MRTASGIFLSQVRFGWLPCTLIGLKCAVTRFDRLLSIVWTQSLGAVAHSGGARVDRRTEEATVRWVRWSVFLGLLLGPAPGVAGDFCADYLKAHAPKGRLVVYSKAEQRLCYFQRGAVAFSHRASHGRADGPKACQGDGKTPEGRYQLEVSRRSSGVPLYKTLAERAPGFMREKLMTLHRRKGRVRLWPTFMNITYPNRAQVRQAKTHCKDGRAGYAVGIHGSAAVYKWMGVAQSWANHSDGCIVLDRSAMSRFEALITRKVSILILPDR